MIRYLILFLLVFGKLHPQERPAVDISNRLANQLFNQLKQEDFICSPYSTAEQLIIAYYAAKEDTQKELKQALHIDESDQSILKSFAFLKKTLTGSGKVAIGNAFWVQSDLGFNETLQENIENELGQVFHQEDFFSRLDYTRGQIIRWLSAVTKGKITSLVQPNYLTTSTKLVLTNILYFQDYWRFPFSLRETKDQPFHVNDFIIKQVPMMNKIDLLPYAETSQYTLAVLPFASAEEKQAKEPEFSLIVILPKDSAKDFNVLQAVDDARKASQKVLKISLPRIRLNDYVVLNAPLQAIGLQLMFANQANFGGMVKGGVFVNKLLNFSLFTVNELGMEVSPAVVETKSKIDVQNPIEFVVNRPFHILLIENRTGLVLLMGHISQHLT